MVAIAADEQDAVDVPVLDPVENLGLFVGVVRHPLPWIERVENLVPQRDDLEGGVRGDKPVLQPLQLLRAQHALVWDRHGATGLILLRRWPSRAARPQGRR